MFQDITLEQLQKADDQTIIDVRSPKEYNETTIPGSINIPLFNDEERAEVGTLYKQTGKEAAKERGLEIMSAKLPEFIEQFKQIDSPKTVFCWRGGMRSRTAATVTDLMGLEVSRLEGGFRAYREWVTNELEKEDFPPDIIVLNGNTGTGKTKILYSLAENGYPIIDLEGMAGHRGSIFGHIGLEPNIQKEFESQFVQKMNQYKNESFVLTEGESRGVGKATIPEFFYQKKEQSTQLFIHMPNEQRIENILEDYHPWDHHDQFVEAFNRIRKRIHTPIAKQIANDLEYGHYREVIQLLLEYYYDPRYEHTKNKYPEENIRHIWAENNQDAADQIKTVLSELYPSKTAAN